MGYPSKVPRCVKVSIWGRGEQTESIRQLVRVMRSTSKGKLFLIDVPRVKMNQTKT